MIHVPTSILLTIDMPPMGKARPRFGGGHAHMPKNYMEWKKKFAALAKKQSSGRINRTFLIDIKIRKKTGKMRSDIDNVAGSVLDALQDCGIIENDRDCVGLSIAITKAAEDYLCITLCETDRDGVK